MGLTPNDSGGKPSLGPGRIARGCGASVAVLGFVVLVGWAADLAVIKSVIPGMAEMKANTALCFLLSGAAVWISATPSFKWRHSIRSGSGLLIVALGLATVFEYVSGANLGIDEMLILDPQGTGTVLWGQPVGRMALATALAFSLVGSSLLLLQPRTSASQSLVSLLLKTST